MGVRTRNRGRPPLESVFSCGRSDRETLFDRGARGRKGQEGLQKSSPTSSCLC